MSARAPLRSLLFVPGDSEKKLGKIPDSPADAIIIDLEDSVTPARKAEARNLAREVLQSMQAGANAALWVRINPLETEDALVDLAAVMPAAPAGIMLPKASGPEAIARLSDMIAALEVAHNVPRGQTAILPVATETAAAALALPRYAAHELPRLAGLSWGAEDLSAYMGASRKREDDGRWTSIYRHVRSQTLLAAHAARVAAIDTLYADFRDAQGLEHYVREARSDGFTGMLAIHPAQVEPINTGFSPSDAEIVHARAVVRAFADDPDAGAVSLNGAMLDRPHLLLAERILASAAKK